MQQTTIITKRMSVGAARSKFADVVNTVYYRNEPILVERDGKPMAVLVSPEQWDRYQQLAKDRFFAAVDTLQHRNTGADPAEVERMVTAAVEEVRRERYERNGP